MKKYFFSVASITKKRNPEGFLFLNACGLLCPYGLAMTSLLDDEHGIKGFMSSVRRTKSLFLEMRQPMAAAALNKDLEAWQKWTPCGVHF